MIFIFCEILLKGCKLFWKYRLIVVVGDCYWEEIFSKYEFWMGILVKLYGSIEMGVISVVSLDELIEICS